MSSNIYLIRLFQNNRDFTNSFKDVSFLVILVPLLDGFLRGESQNDVNLKE